MRGNPFRGNTELTQITNDWLQFLLENDQLEAIAVYGSPYALEQIIPQLPSSIPYAFSYGQMANAQTIALSALLNSTQEDLPPGATFDRVFTD